MSYISFVSQSSCKKIARNLLKERTKNLESDHFKFLQHIAVCQSNRRFDLDSDSNFVYVPHTFLDEHFGSSSIFFKELVSTGLYDIHEYSQNENRCRGFKIKDELIKEFWSLDAYKPGDNSEMVNSLSGFKYKPSHTISDAGKHKYPELIVSAMNAVTGCPINEESLYAYLQTLSPGDPDYYHANAILNNSEFGFYKPEYEPCSSGRVFERYGLQVCRRGMRVHALQGKQVINNDLKSSQAFGFLHQLSLAGMDCKWLERYLTDASFKSEVMGDLDKSIFKTLFYAVSFGGTVTRTMSTMKFKDAGKKLIKDYAKNNDDYQEKDLDKALGYFCDATAEFQTAIANWRNYIVTPEYLGKRVKNAKGKEYFTNDCGMKLCISDFRGEKLKRKLAAHILQGQESCFIKHLILVCRENGVKVYGDMHDGLLTDSTVTEAIVAVARERSGYPLAQLEVKGIGE